MDEERGTQKEIAQRYADRVSAREARSGWRRVLFWVTCVAVVGGGAGLYLAERRPPAPAFFNTGPLSLHHRALENDCAACHEAAESLTTVRVAEVLADRFRNGAPSFARIDRACLECHQGHDFHEPNVAENRSCSACHEEHQGPGAMRAVTTLDCASCHNDRSIMQVAAERGREMPASYFRLNPKVIGPMGTRPVILNLPRPADGYTTAFASFSEGHPEFQVRRENFRDGATLRFNHRRHLEGADIPATKEGGRLDCASCHQAEADGRYMRRVSFEASCQQCHALQFDVKNPSFQLPHGDAQLVRTFLRTLPAQYGEYARREKGLTSEAAIGRFAAEQVRGLQKQFGSGAELERAVFFATNPYRGAQEAGGATRASYAGCAFCHEVKASGGGAEIVRPVMMDRWMPHAQFNHARHAGVASCRECHASAVGSQLTSDVLMPTKESCTSCHNPRALPLKRASAECSTCHVYHAPEVAAAMGETAGAGTFRKMLLGMTKPE